MRRSDSHARCSTGALVRAIGVLQVLLHQFDVIDTPNPAGKPWLPAGGRSTGAAARTRDRLSASIVNRQMTADPGGFKAHAEDRPFPPGALPIYSYSTAGIVLSPLHNELLCGYPYDAGSVQYHCA
jgi:hypothetical protein